MNITPHSYAETFIAEDAIKAAARARGLELGALDVTQGTGAYLRHLAHQLSAQSVVEIGTGSGFQTSILCAMGIKVFSIERQKELYLKAKPIIHHMNYNPKLFYGDGYKGRPLDAPFDKILVTCGAPYIPDALLQQLKVGGMLVIPIGEGETQLMQRINKISDTEFKTEEFGVFSFVPMLENTK